MTPSGTALGVLYSLLGSFGHSFGLTLQRKAHIQRQKISHAIGTDGNLVSNSSSLPPIYTNILWLVGFIIYIVSSSVFPTLALIYLPVFVTAPLSSVNLAANTLCAGFVLNSKISWRDYRDTILVTFGAIWIAIFATIDEKERSLNDLIELYTRPIFIVYFIIYQILVLSLIFAEIYLRKRYRFFRSKLSNHGSTFNSAQESSFETQILSTNKSPGKSVIKKKSSSPSYDTSSNIRLSDSTKIKDLNPDESESSYNLQNAYLLRRTASLDHISPMNDDDFNESTPLLLCDEFPVEIPAENSSNTTSPFLSRSGDRKLSYSEEYHESSSSTRIDDSQLIPTVAESDDNILKSVLKTENAAGLLSGFISGLICSMSILFTKTSVELLSLTIKGDNQFKTPLSWFIVLSLVSTALGNLYYFNRGLRLSSTIVMIPLAFCSYTVSTLINSLIYYNQLKEISAFQILMVLFGLFIVFSGVLLLARRQFQSTPKL
ncbi:putative magnesium transporter NIPA8 [Smittium mucronatum]|uniref:Putative magnesium transporter NIPA8 n=1 Tax=Smittium mucronatum TaxID=133383 RepID=A0A1R0GLV4_9FUNG|nr:putative magnesium transporter NIPA8 [Smittium mucronatum]